MSESTLCSTETALPQFRDVMSPYDGRVVGAVSLTEATAGNAVIETARIGARKARALSRNARPKILDGAATEIEQRNDPNRQTQTAPTASAGSGTGAPAHAGSTPAPST